MVPVVACRSDSSHVTNTPLKRENPACISARPNERPSFSFPTTNAADSALGLVDAEAFVGVGSRFFCR
jgi:hypothetical protein